MGKKLLQDPSILLLLISNGWCMWYFSKNPDGFGTVVWIYWWQSVIIGLFNFIDIATLKNYNPGGMKINDTPIGKNQNGCIAAFFVMHYGIFHLVYGIFLLVSYNITSKTAVLLGIAAFFIESLWALRRKKIYERTNDVNIGFVMFLPYVRVIPMHLMIIIPRFLGVTPTLIFLILKALADIIFYRVSVSIYKSKAEQ